MSAIDRYFDNLGALIERALRTQGEAMEQAAQAIAKCLREGHMLYTLGTGHGHLLALEVFYRAGGMARVCPILDERLMLHINASESTLWERREEIVSDLLVTALRSSLRSCSTAASSSCFISTDTVHV